MGENVSSTRNIYLYNLLKASSVELTQDYSYLISRLINVESQISLGSVKVEDFSQYILKSFGTSRHSFKIARVCLAFCLPNSRKLQIISSFQSPEMPENTMTTGYFCYVSPKTSLFSNKTSEVRTYSNIEKIVDSYHQEKRPVQRSIGRLHQMGIKSGLTIPIYVNEMFGGFLFLNSREMANFDNFKDEDYVVLCALKLIAKNVINLYMQDNLNLDKPSFDIAEAINPDTNIFNHSTFTESFKSILSAKRSKTPDVRIKEQISKAFFFPQADAIHVLVKVLEILGLLYTMPEFVFDMSLIDAEASVELKLKQELSPLQEKQLNSMIMTAGLAGFKLYIKDHCLALSTAVQIANQKEVQSGYSIL